MDRGVEHNEGRIEETCFYQSWRPDGDARAVLLVVHGLAEHSGRYAEFAEYFCGAGYAVYALDLPGHGQSAGPRCHVDRFADFTEAVERFLAHVSSIEAGRPVVLVGHSMGGLISAAFLLQHQSEFAAAVLSGPAIQAPEQPSGCAMLIMRALSRVTPRMGVMKIEAEGVSRDPEVVRKYVEDPLVFDGKVTARLAAELFGAMGAVAADAGTIELPLLILHGGADSLTSVAGSQALHDRVRSSEKKITVYDGLYHEIFNEPERVEVLNDMRGWLDKQL